MSTPHEAPAPLDPAKPCPNCGYTLAELRRTGRLGCAQCYGPFAPLLAPQLPLLHRGTRHHGKVPARHLPTLRRDGFRKTPPHATAGEDLAQTSALP
jgi:protein arginine kinase activator